MTVWIGFFATLSAVFELIGTWTVWTTYRQSSNFATILSGKLKNIRENEPTYNDMNHVSDITLGAIQDSLSPLKPKFKTYAGLVAFALGAMTGLVAALLALN